MAQWEVVVGNLGSVHSGTNKQAAMRKYREYVDDSQANYGRAAGENVTLMKDGDVVEQFVGEIAQIDFYVEGWDGIGLAEWTAKLEREPLRLRLQVMKRLAKNPALSVLIKMAEEQAKHEQQENATGLT